MNFIWVFVISFAFIENEIFCTETNELSSSRLFVFENCCLIKKYPEEIALKKKWLNLIDECFKEIGMITVALLESKS